MVSIFRLAALSSIDYSDITFNIPHALIFSALEPCIAVTLACIPVLLPLLGKGGHSATGTALGVGSAKLNSKNGTFEPLNNDDSSQYQLRPVGPRHDVEARAAASSGSGSDSDDRPEFMVGSTERNIVVKHEWRVASEGNV